MATAEAREGGGGGGGVRNGTGVKAGEVAHTWRRCMRGLQCVMVGARKGGGGGGGVRDGTRARARVHGRDGVRARA